MADVCRLDQSRMGGKIPQIVEPFPQLALRNWFGSVAGFTVLRSLSELLELLIGAAV
jgi:hypothetical protein